MHIFIGADHRGFQLKETLRDWLESQGHQVTDCGNTVFDPDDDFPDFALAVAEKVVQTADSRGIVVCGSGVGVNIAANKVKGIRASTGINADEVRHARKHDDLNVLALSSDYTDEAETKKMIEVFLNTPFEPEERFIRRLKKIAAYEANLALK